jgi:hypothetical protein
MHAGAQDREEDCRDGQKDKAADLAAAFSIALRPHIPLRPHIALCLLRRVAGGAAHLTSVPDW